MSKTDRKDAIREKLEQLKGGTYGEAYDTKYSEMIVEAKKTVIYVDVNKLYPAPVEWNFFPEISESKMLEMIFSIQENGLFNPIIVWEQENGYMILSGHNRVRAYRRIVEEYRDADGFNENDYKNIPAIIFTKNEINESKAKEIIIDTNYIQRDEDKRLMPIIIKSRLDIVRERKDVKGNTIDIVAKELGLSSTKVYEDQLIANKIIEELNELFFEEKIRKKSLLRFAWFDMETQKWIYNEFKDNLIDENIMKLKKTMNKLDIEECFKDTEDRGKIVTVSIRIPEELREEFREMAIKWVKKKEKRA